MRRAIRSGIVAGICCCGAGYGEAAQVTRVDAPPPAYADMEASSSVILPPPPPTARTLCVTLRLDAAQTNQAEFALGTGTGHGPDGAALVAGWDRGGWFVRCDRLRRHLTAGAANPAASGPRALEVRVRFAPDGTPVSVAFEADGIPVALGGPDAASLPEWLGPGGWDALRVTARGGAGNVSAEAGFIADGTRLIVR